MAEGVRMLCGAVVWFLARAVGGCGNMAEDGCGNMAEDGPAGPMVVFEYESAANDSSPASVRGAEAVGALPGDT